MLLTTAYFPPISWFAAIVEDFTLSVDEVKSSCVYLEACENYQKQSWRNRCCISTSQGKEVLNVPVIHTGGKINHPITEILVDYSTNWVLKTKRAIVSAYMTSAYFEYYKDELFAILDSHPARLWDLNMELIRFFVKKIGLSVDFYETTEFNPPTETGTASPYGKDHRFDIHPKRPDTVLEELKLEKPYFQVFSQKYGFQSNLSIMDLLFNEGPDSILYLKKLESPS